MPYKRRYKRRTKRPARAWYQRKYSAMELAGKAYTAARYLKGMINTEKKHFDTDINAQTPTSSGTLLSICDIAQGDNIQERLGNSILCKSALVRLTTTINATATATFVRVLVIRDKQQIADTDPALNKVLDGSHGTYITAPHNTDYVGRFETLYDRVHKVDDNSHIIKYTSIYCPINKHIRFNGAASTDVQKNGLYLLLISSEATNAPTLDGFARISFYDN